jgi:hypothetical protein
MCFDLVAWGQEVPVGESFQKIKSEIVERLDFQAKP